jgi:hypothetical protein
MPMVRGSSLVGCIPFSLVCGRRSQGEPFSLWLMITRESVRTA